MSNMSDTPRKHFRGGLFQGTQKISGFYFDTEFYAEARIIQLLHDHWTSHCKIYQQGNFYLLLSDEEWLMDTRQCPGIPLIKQYGIFSSVALSNALIRQHKLFPNQIVLVHNAELMCLSTSEMKSIDLSGYIDLSPCRLIASQPLVEEVRELQVSRHAETKSPDQIFDQQGLAPAPSTQALMQQLHSDNQSMMNRPIQFGMPNFGFWSRLSSALFGRFGSRSGNTQYVSYDTSHYERRDTLFSRLGDMFKDGLMRRGLSRILSRQHAQYLARLSDLLKNGDPEEALKHAIPLSSVSEMFNQRSRGFFGFLRPDSTLNFLTGGMFADSVDLADDYYEHLQEMYRAMFERLDKAREYKQAAYVLFKLLDEKERAIEYMEEHDLIRFAAELADAYEMEPAIRIRLWFQLGEIDKAIELAIRYECFAQAVAQLEKRDKAQALVLREKWALLLAKAGRYDQAIEALWESHSHGDLLEEWMRIVIAQGGLAAARNLARMINFRPHDAEETLIKCLKLLYTDYHDSALERAEFARALSCEKTSTQTRQMASHTVRAILNDLANNQRYIERSTFFSLVNYTADGALRADIPKSKFSHDGMAFELQQRDEPLDYEFNVADNTTVYDCIAMPKDRFLLALGEHGVRYLNRTGKVLADYQYPVYELVYQPDSQRHLGINQRGNTLTLYQIDMDKQKMKPWDTIQMTSWSRKYNGMVWIGLLGNRIVALNTQSKRCSILWQVREKGVQLVQLSEYESELKALIVANGRAQVWSFGYPDLDNRNRELLTCNTGNIINAPIRLVNRYNSLLLLFGLRRDKDGNDTIEIFEYRELDEDDEPSTTPERKTLIVPPPARPAIRTIAAAAIHDDWLLVTLNSDEGCYLQAYHNIHYDECDIKLNIFFRNVKRIQYRIQGNRLVVAANSEVRVFSLDNGALTHTLAL